MIDALLSEVVGPRPRFFNLWRTEPDLDLIKPVE
jgi:hypothetical protein